MRAAKNMGMASPWVISTRQSGTMNMSRTIVELTRLKEVISAISDHGGEEYDRLSAWLTF